MIADLGRSLGTDFRDTGLVTRHQLLRVLEKYKAQGVIVDEKEILSA